MLINKNYKDLIYQIQYFNSKVRHEAAQGDEGRPLGAGLQEQASNRLKLLWSRARVVSVKEKAWHRIMSGEVQGDERKRTTDEVSK
jgi:hypothetical protein